MHRGIFFVLVCLISPILSAGEPDVARGKSSPKRPDPMEFARRVDRSIAEEIWQPLREEGKRVRVATLADDATFLRRVTLDLAGRLPTMKEIRDFSAGGGAELRHPWIKRLLDNKTFGGRWGNYWRDVVLSRRIDERALAVRQSFDRFLTDAFNRNRPWDEVARSLIMAEGNVREVGETGIIMAQMGKPEETVAELSRVLLGVQIQCAQCHDHPYDRWEREQFHQLAAFFPRVAVRPQRGEQRSFVVYALDFEPRRRRGNNANRYRGTLEHTMPDLVDPTAPGTIMVPTFFVSGEKLTQGTSDAERRQSLANAFTDTDNPWFARAFVNRIWTELVGEGFYPSVDDIGPDRSCVAPETLGLLCEAFVASDHDVKWLFETIALTDAYRRKSISWGDEPSVPFVASHPRRLHSYELFQAIVQATAFPQRRLEGRRGPETVFDRSFGFDPSLPPESRTNSIPQMLQLMNGPLLERLVSGRQPGSVAQLSRRYSENTPIINTLYLRSFSRLPSQAERRTAERQIAAADHREEGLEDILWALINSAEFLHRS